MCPTPSRADGTSRRAEQPGGATTLTATATAAAAAAAAATADSPPQLLLLMLLMTLLIVVRGARRWELGAAAVSEGKRHGGPRVSQLAGSRPEIRSVRRPILRDGLDNGGNGGNGLKWW